VIRPGFFLIQKGFAKILVFNSVALLIGKGPAKNHDEIHESTDAEETCGEEPKQTGSDLANDEAMNA